MMKTRKLKTMKDTRDNDAKALARAVASGASRVMVRYGTPNMIDKIDGILAGAYVYVCLVNDIADTAMRDAIEYIQKSGMYRMKTKRYCREAVKVYDGYQKKLEQTLNGNSGNDGKFGFWMDLADAYTERAQKHIDNLRHAVAEVLNKNHCKEVELKSCMITARTMINFAVENYDGYFQVSREREKINIEPMFRPARLGGVKTLFESATDCLFDKYDESVNLDDDKQCQLAMDVISTQLLNPEVVNKAANDFISKYYPEIAEDFEYDKK